MFAPFSHPPPLRGEGDLLSNTPKIRSSLSP